MNFDRRKLRYSQIVGRCRSSLPLASAPALWRNPTIPARTSSRRSRPIARRRRHRARAPVPAPSSDHKPVPAPAPVRAQPAPAPAPRSGGATRSGSAAALAPQPGLAPAARCARPSRCVRRPRRNRPRQRPPKSAASQAPADPSRSGTGPAQGPGSANLGADRRVLHERRQIGPARHRDPELRRDHRRDVRRISPTPFTSAASPGPTRTTSTARSATTARR